MKFDSLFDYRYFLKGVEDSIIDKELSLRIKGSKTYEISDLDYFLLTDSIDSYMNELKYHSKAKKFYKNLVVEELNDSNIPNLFALLTHLSIGLCDRKKVRNEVNLTDFLELKSMIDSMIVSLLDSGKVRNTLFDLLNND